MKQMLQLVNKNIKQLLKYISYILKKLESIMTML